MSSKCQAVARRDPVGVASGVLDVSSPAAGRTQAWQSFTVYTKIRARLEKVVKV